MLMGSVFQDTGFVMALCIVMEKKMKQPNTAVNILVLCTKHSLLACSLQVDFDSLYFNVFSFRE